MAERKPSINQVIDTVSTALSAADLSYQPSDDERYLKHLFLTLVSENPTVDTNRVTAAAIEHLTGDSRINKWWSKPGFKEWFCNRVEAKAKAAVVLDKLLDSFNDIALSEDPKSYGSKVAAAKFLGEFLGHTGRAKTPPPALGLPTDPDELRAYIKQLETADAKDK